MEFSDLKLREFLKFKVNTKYTKTKNIQSNLLTTIQNRFWGASVKRKKKAKLCKMSMMSAKRTSKNFQFTSITFLLIITCVIHLCNCDQGKKDTFIFLNIFNVSQLFSIVGGSFCCCKIFCVWLKKERSVKRKKKTKKF